MITLKILIKYKKRISRNGDSFFAFKIRRVILRDYLNGTLLYVYEFMNFNIKEKEL